MDLAATQRWMQQALLRPERLEDADSIVCATANLTGSEQIAIYQRSYALRLLVCMREQFPALTHALGAELFDDFGREYLRDRPAENWTLHDLGHRFPAYLADIRPDADSPEAWIDFIIELAHFERKIFVMFDAPGPEGTALADPSTPDTGLTLQPCFDLAAFSFPVARYYHAVKAGSDPPLPAPEPSCVALVRRDYIVRTISVTPLQHDFLKLMRGGMTLDDAFTKLAAMQGHDEGALRYAWSSHPEPRNTWLNAGFFVQSSSRPSTN